MQYIFNDNFTRCRRSDSSRRQCGSRCKRCGKCVRKSGSRLVQEFDNDLRYSLYSSNKWNSTPLTFVSVNALYWLSSVYLSTYGTTRIGTVPVEFFVFIFVKKIIFCQLLTGALTFGIQPKERRIKVLPFGCGALIGHS